MKIAFITDTFHPMVDGITIASTQLGEGLRKRGNTVRYWACTTKKAATYPNTKYFYGLPFPPYPSYGINLISHSLEKSILDFSPDIIHIHTPGVLGLKTLLIAKRNKIPCVFTYHTNLHEQIHYLPFSRTLSRFYRRTIDATIRYFINRCDFTIAPTEYTRAMLGETQKITIIPNPVETEIFYPRKKQKQFFKRILGVKSKNIVLVVGRIIKEKNLDKVLDIATMMPECCFIFVGTGPYLNKLIQKSKSAGLLNSNVFFTGIVEHDALPMYYSNASLLFFPSTYDTFGLVALEALLCKLPVVIPKNSAQSEILKGMGVITYKQNYELDEIKKALQENSEVSDRLVMKIRRRYNKERIAKDHESLYSNILHNI